ncbi:uncharacterized protein OCT59_017123 [Rhizophagus irregularis]|uniref:F-box domain-containing protein n=3 Tax=Rhizophagus irregularis TaxID=588596 RepID=A0A015LGE1_RHIIW|nr:hypothetical protein RirG_076740 [Rhizophagus irregularis DAOM 197198w]UZO24829.1 hypothetical protein OCT59_017123 [Rhizophagus irregularis]
MSKFNKDILFLIFEKLQNNSKNSKFLFSCLMVNRIWCETMIPILWKNPWCYSINYCNKNSLYSIITSYLSNDIIESLTKKEILISNQSLAFDYLSFCRSIDTKIIDVIISIGSSSEYDQFLLQEEIYSLFIKKCPEIKYLNIRGTYEIVYLPEAKFRLESLCELTCDTLIDPRYFYRLAHICQQIQRIIIINKNLKANYGTIKLIELQKNLKYFKWKDEEYLSELLLEDPYKDIFNILKKHANTLNHFENNDFNEKLEKVAYRDLEILKIDFIEIYQVNYIIKNSLYLKELLINDYHWDEDSFNDDSINFIRTIYENCFLIECLSIPIFPLLENHFIEFEKLLKRCQNLRSLYFKDTYYKARELEYGDYLSNSLVKEASINLRVIRISYDIRFSLKAFETFFEKWKGRPAVSIHFDDYYFYHKNGLYMNLISKYKIEGVIKDIGV